MLTSSTQLQNRLFHVVERTRTSTKCQKMKSARAKRAKILFFIVKYEKCTCEACKNTVFHCKICKFVGFLLPSSSWLLKLPNEGFSASLLEWSTKLWCQTSCQESHLHHKKITIFVIFYGGNLTLISLLDTKLSWICRPIWRHCFRSLHRCVNSKFSNKTHKWTKWYRAVSKWLSKNQNQSNYSDQSKQEQAVRSTNHNS